MTSDFLHFPLAQSGWSFLIYLVIGVFWVIGQLTQQKKAKEKALEMRKKREAREEEERRTGKKIQTKNTRIETELEAFLGKLAQPEPVTAPEQTLQKRRTVQVDDIQFDSVPPPPAPPPLPATPPPVRKKERGTPRPTTDIGELDMEASFKQIKDIKEVKEMMSGDINQSLEQQALANVRSMMVDLSSGSMVVQTISMPTMRTVTTRTNRPALLKKSVFKKAVVASVLLDTPKALQEDPFKETP